MLNGVNGIVVSVLAFCEVPHFQRFQHDIECYSMDPTTGVMKCYSCPRMIALSDPKVGGCQLA